MPHRRRCVVSLAVMASLNATETAAIAPEVTEAAPYGRWRSMRGRAAFLAGRSATLTVGLAATMGFVVLAVLAPWLAPYDPLHVFDPNTAPGAQHLFGTDSNGMDIFSRVIFGARYAFGIAVPSIVIGLAIGMPVGLFAGYKGGVLDEVILRVLDVIRSFPAIIFALAVVAATGSSMTNVILVIGFIDVPLFARMVRAEVLGLRAGGLVDSAVAAGNPTWRIVMVHLLPNTFRGAAAQFAPRIAMAIRVSATLAFVGVGVQAPAPEWGAMIRLGSEQVMTGEWWVATFPGLALVGLIFAANLVGDGFQELFDPQHARRTA